MRALRRRLRRCCSPPMLVMQLGRSSLWELLHTTPEAALPVRRRTEWAHGVMLSVAFLHSQSPPVYHLEYEYPKEAAVPARVVSKLSLSASFSRWAQSEEFQHRDGGPRQRAGGCAGASGGGLWPQRRDRALRRGQRIRSPRFAASRANPTNPTQPSPAGNDAGRTPACCPPEVVLEMAITNLPALDVYGLGMIMHDLGQHSADGRQQEGATGDRAQGAGEGMDHSGTWRLEQGIMTRALNNFKAGARRVGFWGEVGARLHSTCPGGSLRREA